MLILYMIYLTYNFMYLCSRSLESPFPVSRLHNHLKRRNTMLLLWYIAFSLIILYFTILNCISVYGGNHLRSESLIIVYTMSYLFLFSMILKCWRNTMIPGLPIKMKNKTKNPTKPPHCQETKQKPLNYAFSVLK